MEVITDHNPSMSIDIALQAAGPSVPPLSAEEKAGFSLEQISGPDGIYAAQADLREATVGAYWCERNLQNCTCARVKPNSDSS